MTRTASRTFAPRRPLTLADIRARLAVRAVEWTANEARMGRMADYRCPRTGIIVLAIRPDGAVTTVSL